MRRRNLLTLLLLIITSIGWSQDKLSEILSSELKIQMEGLSKERLAPYYMDFKVTEHYDQSISSSFGAILNESNSHNRYFKPHIRVGDTMFDNFYYSSQSGKSSATPITLTDNEDDIRSVIWSTVDATYKNCKSTYERNRSHFDVKIKQEDTAPIFSETKVEKYYEEPLSGDKYNLDFPMWKKRINGHSAKFMSDDNIISGNAALYFNRYRKYFISSEGASVVQNETYALLQISATIKAEDGMELPLYISYFAYTPDGLPSEEKVNSDVDALIAKLIELRNSPVVSPYTGPAIMSGSAAGVFFHEIFGHRVEGQRMKSDTDGQTFKKMVGEQILPEYLTVYCDPSIRKYNGEDLNGSYNYDDQGVKGRRVDIVKDGILNEFLMSRTAIDGFPSSNGHGRAQLGYDPTTRQSNLIVESSDLKSDAELRQLLLDEVKRQGKDYGYFFKEVSAGLALTGAGQINSFNVTPLEVYRIYLDGREDELVRGVDMIGTPLSIFENISYGGGTHQVFTGMCGAESGGIPVTAIAPKMLITKIEVQQVAKNRNQPPLLPKPEVKK